jgi:hypothetical protein
MFVFRKVRKGVSGLVGNKFVVFLRIRNMFPIQSSNQGCVMHKMIQEDSQKEHVMVNFCV